MQDKVVKSIKDALYKLTEPEVLEGFSTKGKAEATKQSLFDHLPHLLIVHLKRFVYDSVGGTQKSHKHINYSPSFEFEASSFN